MKTPEEIKKGLYHCGEDGCSDCPYDDDCGLADHFTQIARDALAYIQQLESRLAQAERERDAAVRDIPRTCGYCKHYVIYSSGLIPNDCSNPEPCNKVSGINTGWQWRGVCPENTE